MDNFTRRQRNFLQNFLKHSTKVIEYGFAYLFAHPELIATMDCEMNKIQSMERLQKTFPTTKAYCQRVSRQAYIDYIVKLTKFGFMYVKCNPEAYGEISQLKNLYGEYSNMRGDKMEYETRQEKIQMNDEPSDDQIWEETFKQINDLNNKLEKLQSKIKSSNLATPCTLKTSRDQLKKMNQRLEKKLQDIEDTKSNRRQREIPVKCPSPCKFPNENMKKLNEIIERDLRELGDKKLQRMQNPKEAFAVNKSPQPPKGTYVVNKSPPKGTYVVKKSAKPRNETFVVNKPKKFESDSDNDSSEVLISSEQLSSPIYKTMPLSEINKKKPPRAGIIERNLIIPVHTDGFPNIKPEFSFKKSPATGHMQVDLKLNFEDGIMYQNKLVDGICIENALPVQNLRNKMK